MSDFPRFSPKTLEFLKKASRQKRPDWLDKNRDDYERFVIDPLQHLTQDIKKKLARTATGYHFPQRGIGRLKRPEHRAREYGALYRDFISYSVSRPKKSRFDTNPNLYLLIQTDDPEGDDVLVAGGLYVPTSKQVRAIREAIAMDATPFDRLFASKSFAASFPGGFSKEKSSSRAPRGFDPNHPRMDWLRLQAFFVWRPYTKKEFASAKFADLIARDWAQVLRLNELLERAIEGRWTQIAAPKKTQPNRLLSRLDELPAAPRKMDF